MMQRLRDAATLMFLGALVMTVKVTPVETMDALAPEVHAADVAPAAAVPQPPATELAVPVVEGEAHATIDLRKLAELAAQAGEAAEQIVILKLEREQRTLLESHCAAADRC